MMDTTRTQFYDFEINENGLPCVVSWESQIKHEINDEGRKSSVWVPAGECTKKEVTSSFGLVEEVQLLRYKNFHGFQELRAIPFDVKVKNPLVSLRLGLLANRHKLLQKLYDDKAIDDKGMNSIVRYISYVDVKSGDLFVRNIQTDAYSEEVLTQLAREGYQSIESSFLFERLKDFPKDDKVTIIEGDFSNNRNRN